MLAYDLPRHGLAIGFTLPGVDSLLWEFDQTSNLSLWQIVAYTLNTHAIITPDSYPSLLCS